MLLNVPFNESTSKNEIAWISFFTMNEKEKSKPLKKLMLWRSKL